VYLAKAYTPPKLPVCRHPPPWSPGGTFRKPEFLALSIVDPNLRLSFGAYPRSFVLNVFAESAGTELNI